MELEIKCINKSERQNIHERIKSVGGSDWSGKRWKMSLEDAVANAESRQVSFHTNVDGRKVGVIVATTPMGQKYLKTEADSTMKNNLLSLPECP